MIKVITGYRAKVIRTGMLIHIALIASIYFGNPFRGIKVLAEIRAKRQKVQGLQRIKRFFKSAGRYFFSDNIPGWPSRAFNGFFRSEVMRISAKSSSRTPLSTVFLSVTSKCPLRCPHCYELENLSQTEYLSLDNLKEIIRKFKLYGVYHFQLCGGEPLERLNDLLTLITYARKEADIWINTSGFGLTPEIARSLRSAGLTGAEISLDHWNEDEHNRFRHNPKAFYWASEAARNCNAAGIITSLSLCATRAFISKENLKKYTELAMRWDVSFIRLLEPRETTRFKGNNLFLRPDQVAMLDEYYLNASSPEMMDVYPVVLYPGYNHRMAGCMGAGNRYLYIDPKGDIHACPFCRRRAGNALNDRIEDAVSVLKSFGCQKYSTYCTE